MHQACCEYDADGGLAHAGLQFGRLLCLVDMENFPVMLAFQTSRITSDEPAFAGGDAPMSHWERAVQGAQLSRLQVRR